MGIRIAGMKHFAVDLVEGLDAPGKGSHRANAADLVVERLSSGTTGTPKRIAVMAASLLPALQSAEAASSSSAADRPLRVKTSPAIVLSPFTHSGGIFALMFALYQARPIVLFEKFTVEKWVGALGRYKPKSASLVPAMVRMILASDVASDALHCLSAIRCGTAPLEAETQLAFEKRFGVPVLVDFGATEFIGGVAGWSLEDHRRHAQEKRGSAGRPRPDVQLRAVDAGNGEALPPGTIGLLEIRSPRFGPDWIRTTDLASLDEDGFLYIHGRADDAINRGGFKVLPDEVAAVLRAFPGVSDVAVLGVPHSRLGEVPVAFIETGGVLDRDALEAFARERLASYQIPAEFRFVVALPRTTTLKVSRPELRALYQSGSSS
jgi:acyl-CoA synthetase (AMP-forming)/AMP-acid ligase II